MPTNVVPFGATLEIFGGFWEGLTTLGQPHLIASFLLGHFGLRQFIEATRDQAFGQRIIFSDILRVAAVFVLLGFWCSGVPAMIITMHPTNKTNPRTRMPPPSPVLTHPPSPPPLPQRPCHRALARLQAETASTPPAPRPPQLNGNLSLRIREKKKLIFPYLS